MCWNSDISINTFLFTCFALCFIYVTNTYTKYKSPGFTSIWIYLIVFEVASMQLIEFFLWRNLNNQYINKQFSMLAAFIICLQILTIILIIPNNAYKHLMLTLGFTFFLFYSVYKYLYNPIVFHTHVGQNGHLVWEWMDQKGWEHLFLIGIISLYLIPAWLSNNLILFMYLLITLLVTGIMYYKYKTASSMWCWLANIFLLYFIIDILLIQPFYEYNGLC